MHRRLTHIFKLPLLVSFLEEEVEVLGLSETNAHDAGGDGFLVVANTTVLRELLGDLAVAVPFFAHVKHELVIGIKSCRHPLVISWEPLALLTAA